MHRTAIRLAAAIALLTQCAMSFAYITHDTNFPPNSPQGNVVNVSYAFTDRRPARYFSVITTAFTFNAISSSPRGSRFVATSFWLDPLNGSGGGDQLYMGINPTQPKDNYPGQAHFSYFGSHGGTLYSRNCAAGADGGGGITCAIDVPTTQGYTYRLDAKLTEATSVHSVLQGWLTVFDSTGTQLNQQKIGEFEVVRGNMGLSYPQSWVEGSSDPCSDLVKTSITFRPLVLTLTRGRTYEVVVDTVPSNKCGVYAEPVGLNAYGKPGGTKMTYGVCTTPTCMKNAASDDHDTDANRESPAE